LGTKKALILGTLALPALLVVFAGRQTNIDLTDRHDTAQSRIQLWSEGLMLMRQAPAFGIGKGQFADEAGLVAHNSYVHAFTELGLFGGTWFVGAIYLALSGLHRLGKHDLSYPDAGHLRLRPVVFGIITAYAAGLTSLSRCYVVSTYAMIGLATAYISLVRDADLILPRVNGRLSRNLAAVSGISLLAIYVFVKLFVQQG
jgi:hypothetical protein